MSFKLPPEVTVKSEQYGNKHAYVLRHEKLGELGRLVISEYMGQTHFSHEVVGANDDPLTEKRREILEPITKAMVAEVEKKLGNRRADITPPANYSHGVPPKGQTIEAQFLPCTKCRANVAHIIYSQAF